jgi:cytochrome c oxidase subunit 2
MNPRTDFSWYGLPAISNHAALIDRMMLAFGGVVLLFTIPVFVLMAYFVVKYRRGSTADRNNRPKGDTGLEVAWTIAPFIAVLGFFIWAAFAYLEVYHAPAGALEITAVGKQWMWKFQHPGGQREINDLHVPVGRPIKLIMSSEDVIHSLAFPVLRIKQDVVPGRTTSMWFEATQTGSFRLQCSQFCGTDHSVMAGRLVVMTPRDYAAWLGREVQGLPLVAEGADAFHSLGCSGCHDPASAVKAPRLEGLYGSTVPLSNGQMVVADERYIHDSIMQPSREIAAGYPNIMPNFGATVDENTVAALVAYIKSLSKPEVVP